MMFTYNCLMPLHSRPLIGMWHFLLVDNQSALFRAFPGSSPWRPRKDCGKCPRKKARRKIYFI